MLMCFGLTGLGFDRQLLKRMQTLFKKRHALADLTQGEG